jgi:hypothetical protein
MILSNFHLPFQTEGCLLQNARRFLIVFETTDLQDWEEEGKRRGQ